MHCFFSILYDSMILHIDSILTVCNYAPNAANALILCKKLHATILFNLENMQIICAFGAFGALLHVVYIFNIVFYPVYMYFLIISMHELCTKCTNGSDFHSQPVVDNSMRGLLWEMLQSDHLVFEPARCYCFIAVVKTPAFV